VDPVTVRKAVEMIVADDLADHVDMNFGCRSARHTQGGRRALRGSAACRPIVSAAVEAAPRRPGFPVTVKIAIGIRRPSTNLLEAAASPAPAPLGRAARRTAASATPACGLGRHRRAEAELEIPVLRSTANLGRRRRAADMDRGCEAGGRRLTMFGPPVLFVDLATAFRRDSPSDG